MAFDREKRGLFQRKLEKPQVKKHTPLKSEGTTGSFSIRNAAGGVFLFFKGIGEWFKLFNSRNHMIPDADNVYDIGSEDKRWRKIWTGTRSLHIGDVTIGSTGTGTNASLTFKAKGSTDETVVGAATIKASTIETPDEVDNIIITAEQNIALRPDNNSNDGGGTINQGNNVYIQQSDGGDPASYTTRTLLRDDGTIKTAVAVNDGNPVWQLGASDAECLHIQTVYDSGAQTLNYVQFTSKTADGATANAGTIRFAADEGSRFDIIDDGVDVQGGNIYNTIGSLSLKADASVAIHIDADDSNGSSTFSVQSNLASGSPSTCLSVSETGNMTVLGDIVLDDGGSIKEAGGTAAITFDASGHITKIGQDSPSNGQVLTWDTSGSPSKAVWAAASGGGSGHVIQNGGSGLTARANLNFDGTYLVATDDSGNDQSDITINGADGGFDGDVMQIGTALTGLNASAANTTVRGALQSVDAILALLAPAKPSNLSALSLSYYSTTVYTAKQSSTGNTLSSLVTTDTTPRVNVNNFYDGDAGVLTAYRSDNGGSSYTTGGTRTLSTSSDTGTYDANNIRLNIVSDEDPHAGTAGSEGFYKQLDARVEQTSALTSQSDAFVFKLVHSITGSSGITKSIYVDTNTTPSISSISLGTVTIANSGNGTFRSGVPYMEQNDDFDVTFTVSNAISHFYQSGNIASAYISGVTETVSNTTSGTKTNGATFSASMTNIDINDSEFVKSPNITCVGYNAAGTSGSGTLATTFNIDSVSGTESSYRGRAGGGGNYPSRGSGADQWGDDYDSTQLLTSTNYNEELQYSNGYFHYPTATDYSSLTPAGPNYGSIGTSNIKWMCEDMGTISSASSVTIQFNSDSGFDNNPLQSSDSFEMFIKVVDSSDETSDVTGWLDLNASFSSGSPSSNGDACLDYANSDIDTKKCTFGSTARTGRVFVRVGWINGGTDPTSGSTRKFTSISMS